MQKRKTWQGLLILAVIALTIYNILPTIFYYTKPLEKPIEHTEAKEIASDILTRVNSLEQESYDWLNSFCDLIQVKPQSISLDKNHPGFFQLDFATTQDSEKFSRFLPRAGNLIPFVPAQLNLVSQETGNPKKIIVERKVPVSFSKDSVNSIFGFSSKKNEKGEITPLYKEIVLDRAAKLAEAIGGESEASLLVSRIKQSPSYEAIFTLAQDLKEVFESFSDNSAAKKRYLSSLTQNLSEKKDEDISQVLEAFQQTRDQIKLEKKAIADSKKNLSDLTILDNKEKILISAEHIITDHKAEIINGSKPLTYLEALNQLKKDHNSQTSTLKIGKKNPYIQEIVINWKEDKILLKYHDDIAQLIHNKKMPEQLIINEIAKISKISAENPTNEETHYSIALNDLNSSNSFLTVDLKKVAKQYADHLQHVLQKEWNPHHSEFQAKNFPIVDFEGYQKLNPIERSLCLVILPAVNHPEIKHLNSGSLYVVACGLDSIIQKYKSSAQSELVKVLSQDIEKLKGLLQKEGFYGHAQTLPSTNSLFSPKDYFFEKADYFLPFLQATRESFNVHGSKQFAVLEFTNVENRIRTLNQIETKMHESLIKARDDFHASHTSLNAQMHYDAPEPQTNILWDNFKLNLKKYFRGDDRRILRWGLDLSGGKTVTIELRDQNNNLVTNEADLKQGINELYNRVNKMGVSEVNIRSVNSNIILDFPGSQGLSASELVKASTMYFHVINEKFSVMSTLGEHVNRFLQEVWNEASVTNHKDIESIQQIACKHLYGENVDEKNASPRSVSAKVLYDQGLRLASLNSTVTGDFNNQTSKIAILRGEDFKEWHGQTHPLLIVFNNYALEGSNLENIRASYDPAKGNFLSFDIKGSITTKEGKKLSPQEMLYKWTSTFSKEAIGQSSFANITKGRGWRMAVVLNNTVISSPTLDGSLKEHAMISGSFTQREISQLSSDLKAGSLSFTPRILSEKNVSAELGYEERVKGIAATFIALALVIFGMIFYYRFAGLVASVAVIFNLLIMWATLQNLHATLTLAGIAGIILTVAMAVDANVLVYERIREEFNSVPRISSAITAGYKKAFSAIFDSNITTIIAALILLHFDAGPIKGFAVTLIIGIASSLVTALFMTRYYFMGWQENPKHQKLTMMHWIKSTNFSFLNKVMPVVLISGVIIMAGLGAFWAKRHTVLGMDFTGGFAINLTVEETPNKNYRSSIEKALLDSNLTNQEFQVQEMNPSNHLRILLSSSLEQKGKAFYGMPLSLEKKNIGYVYENNPRIKWIVKAIEKTNTKITKECLKNLHTNWTVMSGQMSDSMRNNALLGITFALIAIFIYLSIRFEFKYSISAMFCLIHDIFITVSSIALLHACGLPVQLDLHTIAAIMTIIGYSLNDTIIIFDRIREETKLLTKDTLEEFMRVSNHALNATLSRTMITSGITFFVLLILVAMGGSTIFSFALILCIGVVFGTLSSLFVAAPLMLWIHRIQERKESRARELQ
jgi:SecD/SecF fusion protein